MANLLLSLVLLASPPVWARPGEGLCSAYADALRADKVAGSDPHDDSLARLLTSEALQETNGDVRQDLLRMHATQALMSAFGALPRDTSFEDFSIVRFGESGIGAVKLERGHTDCVSLLFFDVRSGHADVMQSPPGVSSVDMRCDGHQPALTRLGGVPSVVLSDGNPYALSVVAWQRGKWAMQCGILAAFAKPTPWRKCAALIDCAALAEAVQAEVAQRAADKDAQRGQLAGPLRRLAEHTPGIASIQDFGGPTSRLGGLAMNMPEAFMIPIGRTNGVAVLGGAGNEGERMLFVWEPAGDVLRPVAAYDFGTQRGKLASISVTIAPEAAANPP